MFRSFKCTKFYIWFTDFYHLEILDVETLHLTCLKTARLHSLLAVSRPFHSFPHLSRFFPDTEFQTSNLKRPLYWLKGPICKPLNCNQINWICVVLLARLFSEKVDSVLHWVSHFCILSTSLRSSYFPFEHLFLFLVWQIKTVIRSETRVEKKWTI